MDWSVFSNFAAPIIALLVGVWVNRRFEDRPKLLTFYGHVSAFKIRPPEGNAGDVFTHSVVIRNTGRRPARNVRVSHNVLPPNVTVYPSVDYATVALADGAREIVFPVLVPGQQVTISYLYFPPTTYQQITTGVRSDEGFAKVVNVLPSVPLPKLLKACIGLLGAIGAGTLAYGGYELLRYFVRT